MITSGKQIDFVGDQDDPPTAHAPGLRCRRFPFRRGKGDVQRRLVSESQHGMAVPARRSCLEGAWDRFQIPRPFTTVTVTFGELLRPEAGESWRTFCQRIGQALHRLEQSCDPSEARVARTTQEVPGPPNT